MRRSSCGSRSMSTKAALLLLVLLLAASSTPTTLAFTLERPTMQQLATRSSSPSKMVKALHERSMESSEDERTATLPRLQSRLFLDQILQKCMATAAVAATFWCAPAMWSGVATTSLPMGDTASTPSLVSSLSSSSSAWAKEMASGSGSRVNKDPESLLRYGLPIQNKEVRKLQSLLESIKQDLGSKRKTAALDSIKKAKTLLNSKDADKMIASCRDAKLCATYLSQIATSLDPLAAAVTESIDNFNGSEQERASLDRAYAAQMASVQTLTLLEEQMIPANYITPVPSQYKDLPQLQGRATVEMKFRKADKSQSFDVNGQTFSEAKLVMVVDGYVAPITSGNFVDLVQRGFYNNMEIDRADGFVVQTGDPIGDAVGYVGPGSASVGNGPKGERLVPLEIFVKGDSAPIYESTIEDEGRGGQATVLPFSSYGAMGWAREEYEVNSGSSQFFWLLFDSDLTPAGKNVLDGRYPCFGYVVEGADFLADIKEGDTIVSAKVTKGLNNLIQPK